MATSSIRAGSAFVELFMKDTRFTTGLKAADKDLRKFGEKMRSLGTWVTAAGTAASLAFVPTIKAASDAVETVNKFEAVFKDQAPAAKAFADALAASVGRSKYAIYDALASLDAFFVGLGFGGSEARKFSQELTALAVDFGSFYNISDDEAMERFISALSGSAQVLDKFGVNIRQAALQEELLAMGVNKTWSEVSEAEKVQARFNVILKSMTAQGAVGDAIKTAGSFGNRMKALKGSLHDAAVEVGNALIPVLTTLVDKVVRIVDASKKWITENTGLVRMIALAAVGVTAAGGALIALGAAATIAGMALGALATVGAAISSVFAALFTKAGLVAVAIAGVAGAIIYVSGSGAKAIQWLSDSFNELRATASLVFKGISDAMAAGDLSLAARVLWLSIKAEFKRGTNALEEVVIGFKQWIATAWYDAVFGLAEPFAEAIAQMAKMWTNFTASIIDKWKGIEQTIAEALITQTAKSQGMDPSMFVGGLRTMYATQADQRKAETEGALSAIDATKTAATGGLSAMRSTLQQGIEDRAGKAMAENAKELADLMKQRDEAIAAAAQAREEAAKKEAAAMPEAGAPPGTTAANEAAGAVAGTFSALAAMRLGTSTAADRTAEATEETAENTGELVAKLDTFLVAV